MSKAKRKPKAPVRRKATPKRLEKFLAGLAKGLSPSGAAMSIGLNRSTMYKLRQSIPGFAERWDEAVEQGSDFLEDELLRRAGPEGVSRKVFYRGEQIDTIKDHSDTLLIVALKARRPEKYRENVRFDIDKLLINELARVSGKIEDQELASPLTQ